MNPIYKFTLNGQAVTPDYKDDLAKEYALETGQRFYRVALSGKFTFTRNDYDYIMAQSFGTEFIFIIDRSNDRGATWAEYYRGKFTKTDCSIDEDDKKIIVSMQTVDEYIDVLAGLEKEYNLTKLAPKIMPLIISKRPLIQIYLPGDSVISCFLGGTYWEQDANEVTSETELENTYFFSVCNRLKEINLTVTGTHSEATGLYIGNTSESGWGTLNKNAQSAYNIQIVGIEIQIPHQGSQYYDEYRLMRKSDNVVLFAKQIASGTQNMDFALTAKPGVTGTAAVELATYKVFARYFLDVDTIQGVNTHPVPTDDITDNNRNYARVIGYGIGVAFISANESTEPTEWGLKDNGKYFDKPSAYNSQEYFPIARSTWRYASIWFSFNSFDWIYEKDGRKPYILKDTYTLGSAINVLLAKIAPGITHEETPEYSTFLYSDYNPISNNKFKLLISQKTNILSGNYDKPAQKAPITLQQITNMLRDCYRCFWYIEEGKFKIEHIKYFRNGGTYAGEPEIGVDLTELESIRSAKKWGFQTSKYDYEKADLAERYQFAWSDDVTPSFIGSPIEVTSKYVSAGKIENVTIAGFTPDIDYMILNPTEINKDGFALFAAIECDILLDKPDYFGNYSEGTNGFTTPKYAISDVVSGAGKINFTAIGTGAGTCYVCFYNGVTLLNQQAPFQVSAQLQEYTLEVNVPAGAKLVCFNVVGTVTINLFSLLMDGRFELPFIAQSLGQSQYIMQNGLMSWTVLQPNYYMDDLPARQVRINETDVYANGIERKKKQIIEYPSQEDPDPMKLIKTYIGNGQVDKISICLHSRMNKITLKYDTE